MVIMALDHARDMFHAQAFVDNPLNLATTTPFLFFTRWITHFCAPVFVLLSGVSAYLQGLRKSKSELSAFLIKRGLWLIFVEAVIITLAITFDLHYHGIILQVIWAIGCSMILLGLMVRFPFHVILIAGIIIVFGHNILDFAEAHHSGDYGLWWDLLHRGNFATHTIFGRLNLVIIYPFPPWAGLMMLGYCLGKIFRPEITAEKRRKFLLTLGFSLIALFIVLRATNLYGDPSHWSAQRNPFYTFLSFINTTKYPPSLLFLCMTIGPALIVLALLEKIPGKIGKICMVYGRVPFLYYVLHFYLLHFFSFICFLLRGHTIAEGLNTPSPIKYIIPGDGYGLGGVYIAWIAVVVLLYPVCRWFSNYKLTHKNWWLSYL